MRVLYASDTALPSQAANTVQSLWTAHALQHEGHEVKFVARVIGAGPEEICTQYGLDGPLRLEAARTLRWPLRSWQYAIAVGLMARTGAFDVLVTRSEKSALVAKRLGVHTLLELHAPVRSRGLLRRISRGRGPALVTISAALRDAVRRQVGERIPVTVIHDGASSRSPMVRNEVPRSWSDCMTVGYVGHLYTGKGMETVAELAERCEWANFVVVGGEHDDLERWRSRLDQRTNITFLGHHAHREIPGILAGLDVGLLPNRTVVRDSGGQDIGEWTSPLKMFEYMAAGLAIIASDLPSLCEVLVDEVNALMCPPEDVDAWVATLGRLADDPELRERLGTRARTDLEQHYSWRRRAQRLTEVIAEAVAADRR